MMLGGNMLEYSPSNPGTAMVDPKIDSESNVTTSPGMPIKLTGQGPQETRNPLVPGSWLPPLPNVGAGHPAG